MKFREYNQAQVILKEIKLNEALEADHPARVINDAVEALDLSSLYAHYEGVGNLAYHPRMMVKVLFYGYYCGVFSCRKIRFRLQDSIAFIYLSGDQLPDFRTINNFRKRHIKELPELFIQIIFLCVEMGMLDFKYLGIDGQKIQANASFKNSKTEKDLLKQLSKIERKMESIIAREIEEPEVEDKGNHKELSKLERKKENLEACLDKLQKAKEKAREEGKSEKEVEKMRINTTDPEANLMPHKDGQILPSYNCQAAVDGKEQVITALAVTDRVNEQEDLLPMLDASEANVGQEHEKGLVDSNFSSFNTLTKIEKRGIDLYMPDKQYEADKKTKEEAVKDFRKILFNYDQERDCYVCPEGEILEPFSRSKKEDYESVIYGASEESCRICPSKSKCTKGKRRTICRDSREILQEKMREKLDSEEGKETYKKRLFIIEPVFGNQQKNQSWIQFHLRGIVKAVGEFALHCIVHNLKKIVRELSRRRCSLREALGY